MTAMTMDSLPSGLLAKKGTAKPAMRRQSQVQQAGFGGGNAMSGWLTGAEDDCGWNDMGDTPPRGADQGGVIGLTPVGDKSDSLYLHSSGDDWDEAEGFDEDQRAEPGWQPAAVAPANPVGAMQDRLREAAPAPRAYTPETPTSYETRSYSRPEPVAEETETPVGLFGHLRAALAHFVAMIFGRGPIVVLHPEYATREKLMSAAAREGCSEREIAERALNRYLDGTPKNNFTSNVMGNA